MAALFPKGIVDRIRHACVNASPNGARPFLVGYVVDDLTAFRRRFGFDLADQVQRHVSGVADEVFPDAEFGPSKDGSSWIAPASDPLDALLEAAERFRSRIASSRLRFTVDGDQIAESVTVSVGVLDLGIADPIDLPRLIASCLLDAARIRDTVQVYDHRDWLTDLPAGERFLRGLRDTLAVAAGAGRPVSLVSLDVDGFRALNADGGAAEGDRILSCVSDCLRRALPAGRIGRLWADEFLVVLDGVRAEDAAFSAESIRRELAAADPVVSMSVGVASSPLHAADTPDLIRKVREARFRARKEGGGHTCVAERDQMVTKTSHFSPTQLERLADLARRQGRSEAAVLREGLDLLLQAYDDGAIRPSVLGHPLE